MEQTELVKLIMPHIKNKEVEQEIHGKKDFIPFVEYRRVLDLTQVNPMFSENKYDGNRNNYRIVNKDKWIDPEKNTFK